MLGGGSSVWPNGGICDTQDAERAAVVPGRQANESNEASAREMENIPSLGPRRQTSGMTVENPAPDWAGTDRSY